MKPIIHDPFPLAPERGLQSAVTCDAPAAQKIPEPLNAGSLLRTEVRAPRWSRMRSVPEIRRAVAGPFCPRRAQVLRLPGF
jgi:hypothetical protein